MSTATEDKVIVSKLMTVTPEMAEAWLGKMPRNRTLSPRLVETYARDMKAGKWQITGEAVKFDTDDNLIDGQHRLRAVILAELPVVMLTVWNLEAESQVVMDTGRKRSAHDALAMLGSSYGTLMAAAARLGIMYDRGELKTAGQSHITPMSNSEILDYVQTHAGLEEATHDVASRNGRLPMRPSVGSFCLMVLRDIDREMADQFFFDLANIRTDGAGDPRFTLLRRLGTAKQNREKLSAITEAHYVFRAWNALRAGEQITYLKTGTTSAAFDFAYPR